MPLAPTIDEYESIFFEMSKTQLSRGLLLPGYLGLHYTITQTYPGYFHFMFMWLTTTC